MEREVFDEKEQKTLSHWTVEWFQVGGLTCYQSAVEIASGYNKCIYVLNIYPNEIWVESTRIYFDIGNSWLPKYFLVVLMDATSENSNVLTVVQPADDDVDFFGGLISTYSDSEYSREDLLSDSYDSRF
jgi:hypothetical protein